MEPFLFMFVPILFILYKLVNKFGVKFLQEIGVIESDPSGNPFLDDERLPLKPLVTAQQRRDAVLRQGFRVEEIPTNLDAIVIGSGIGGLSVAATLSKVGKKVLVLEQHDQAGGCCHSFIEKGYEFNMGIHYVGQMQSSSIYRTFIDQLSDGQVQWGELDDEYVSLIFKTDKEEQKVYPIIRDVETQIRSLKEEFPLEEAAMKRYYDIIDEVKQTFIPAQLVKVIPFWLVKLLKAFNIIAWFTTFFYWNKRSVKEVADELTSNQRLRDIFSYNFGVCGVIPRKTGFALHAIMSAHYSEGVFVPVGGASQIPLSIIPVIERGGGKVFVQAEVIQILMGEKGQAVGVKVKHGQNEHDVFAPLIISDAGTLNTYKFLPRKNRSVSPLGPLLYPKDTMGLITALVGLNASASDLNIQKRKSYYVFLKNDLDKSTLEYLNMSKKEPVEEEISGFGFSFCSSKDHSWEKRYPGKSTITIFIPVNYSWFQEWEDKPVQSRGEEYEAFKNTLGSKVLNIVVELFPTIKDHIDYVHYRGPLSFNNTLRRTRGVIYGLDLNQNRFSILNYAMLRPTTKVPGLYLTGQDVACGGFLGAAMGGLLCAQQILDRPLYFDLMRLHNKLLKSEEADFKKSN